MKGWAAVAFLGLGVLAGGCGSDDDQAAEAARDYLAAAVEGDGEQACDRLTVEGKTVIADIAANQLPELGTVDCAEVMQKLSEFTTEEQASAARENIDQIDGEDVTLDASTATVDAPGANVPITLEMEDGEWKVGAGTLRESFGQNFP